MKTPVNATLEVRVMPIEQLEPAPYNPRKTLQPSDAAYRKLEASLREFGLVEPLIWNELSGRVVGGHSRLRILRKLGIKKVPVSVVRLSEEREKALNILLNNQEAQGRYDTQKLADLLAELEDLPELELTGFDHRTIEALRFEPIEETMATEEPEGMVAVTLEMDVPTYENVAERLDEIVAEFDLITHVRRCG